MTGETLVLSNKSKAIGFILLSALGFAMMSVFVRLAGDLPFTQKSFFRNAVAMVVAAVLLKRDGSGFRWEKGNLPLLLLRASCGTLGIFCNYYAIDRLVLADANILNKMSPFFAILFSLFLLKERANLFQYGMVLVAFGGSMLYRCGRGLYRGPRAFPKTGEKRADRLFLLHFFDAGHAAVSDF